MEPGKFERTGEVVPGDPYMALAVLFPNRIAHATTAMPTKRMTVMEFYQMAPGIPAPEGDDEVGASFIKAVQHLVKSASVDLEGSLTDVKLRI